MKKLCMILPLALILCFMVGCQDKEAMAELEAMKAQAEVEEQNKALIKQYFAELDRGVLEDVDSFADKYISFKCIWHFPGGVNISGIEAIKEYIVGANTSFPDLVHTIDDIIAEGEKVAYRITARGTHKEEFMGIKPTGNEITATGEGICRVLDGKIVEWWMESDYLSLMQQFGMELKPKEGEK
jgi:predicted ester cyclase